MPTIGYGEDGLTHHALHARRAELLRALRDPTPPGDCLVYYRPSCGRAGGSQFGEFDAIVRTSKFIYLIECKWDSGARSKAEVKLPEVQRKRHQILAWLYENWCEVFRNEVEPTWAAFLEQREKDFSRKFPDGRLPGATSLLARNLQSILSTIMRPRRPLRNVLLYFHNHGDTAPTRVVTHTGDTVPSGEFRLVSMAYTPIGVSRYFQMAE